MHIWSVSDSKSFQVCRTLLSILAELNNAALWTVSTCPVISESSSHCSNPLVTIARANNKIAINVILMFHSFFYSLARSRYLCVFLHFFNSTPWSAGTAKSIILQVLSFLLIIVRSVREWMIRLYLKTLEQFACVILQGRFWVARILFVSLVKLQFLAQFPVDHFAHPSRA